MFAGVLLVLYCVNVKLNVVNMYSGVNVKCKSTITRICVCVIGVFVVRRISCMEVLKFCTPCGVKSFSQCGLE